MTASFVRTNNASGTSTAPAVTASVAPADGNLLVIFIGANVLAAGITAVPSGFTLAATNDNAGGYSVSVYYKIASSNGTSYTFTLSGSQPWSVDYYEFAGVDTGTPLDPATAAQADSAGTASFQLGAYTPSQSGDVLVGGIQLAAGGGGSKAVDSSFNLSANAGTRTLAAYKVKTDAVAENPTWSWLTSRGASGILVGFKPAAAAASTLLDRRSPRGVHRGVTRGVS